MSQSQCDLILSHLKAGKALTPLAALDRFGVFRLAARVRDLRDQGHRIVCDNVKLPTGKRIGKYRLAG